MSLAPVSNIGKHNLLGLFCGGHCETWKGCSSAAGLAKLVSSCPAAQSLGGTLQQHLSLAYSSLQVVDKAQPHWEKEHANLTGRVSFAAGDFFDAQTIPKPDQGNTIYIMRSILHDWDDTSSIKILRSLAAAMKGRQAKLVLIEQVCPVLQHDSLACR